MIFLEASLNSKFCFRITTKTFIVFFSTSTSFSCYFMLQPHFGILYMIAWQPIGIVLTCVLKIYLNEIVDAWKTDGSTCFTGNLTCNCIETCSWDAQLFWCNKYLKFSEAQKISFAVFLDRIFKVFIKISEIIICS